MLELMPHFLLALAVAMAVHELAHALAAMAFGVWVQRVTVLWDLGGVQLARWTVRQTTWVIGWFPFVSMVELAGQAREDLGGTEALPDRPYEVQAKAPWKRVVIYLAGGAMNLLLGAVLVQHFGLPATHPMVWANLWIAAMNLGPIGRTDGGRAFDLVATMLGSTGKHWMLRLLLFVLLAAMIVAITGW